MILQRNDLVLSDMIILNWNVTYSPTESMKDIHMYPRYGSGVKNEIMSELLARKNK
jgi:hypothetical protein